MEAEIEYRASSLLPIHYYGLYNGTDEVDYYDGSSDTVGVVTFVCDPPRALAPVNRTVHCLFVSFTNQYWLQGDSFDCGGV